MTSHVMLLEVETASDFVVHHVTVMCILPFIGHMQPPELVLLPGGMAQIDLTYLVLACRKTLSRSMCVETVSTNALSLSIQFSLLFLIPHNYVDLYAECCCVNLL